MPLPFAPPVRAHSVDLTGPHSEHEAGIRAVAAQALGRARIGPREVLVRGGATSRDGELLGTAVRQQVGVAAINSPSVRRPVPEAVLIDARTRPEYEEGHIPGAILIDYYEMGRYLKDLLPTLDPAQRTIVYCYGPDCEDAELLARELYMLGFTDLLVFEGGFEEWVDSGREIEGGEER